MKSYYVIFCMLTCAVSAFSQDMTEGFGMLDSQKFSEATLYFKNILKDNPDNKVARICLGRALGLGGSKAEGFEVLASLRQDHVDDIEVELNYAEGLMWVNRASESVDVYNEILRKEANNRTALLSKSNALSSLGRHEEAISSIDLALENHPDFESNQISKKFIYLAGAYHARSNGNAVRSLTLLTDLKEMIPEDETVLFDLGETHLYLQNFHKANGYYHSLEGKTSDTLRLYSSLSYTNLLIGKKKKFLSYGQKAYDIAKASKADVLDPGLNVVGALVLNNRVSKAYGLLEELRSKTNGDIKVDVREAQIALWQANAGKSLKLFKEVDKRDSSMFEVKMGLAESYFAMNERHGALDAAQKAITLNPKSLDAQRFYNNVNMSLRPAVEASLKVAEDGGGNGSWEAILVANKYLKKRHTLTVGVVKRNTSGVEISDVENNQIFVADDWTLNHKLTVRGKLAFGIIAGDDLPDSQSLLSGGIGMKYAINKIHSTELDFASTYMNYNPQLLSSGIRTNEMKFIYSMYLPSNFGSYNQVILTDQSDGNSRFLYYGSLYYNVSTYPVLQLALNYNTMSYSTQFPEIYFSPDKYQSAEVMIKADGDMLKSGRWTYLITGATGFQWIGDNSKQGTLRLDGRITYAINDRLRISAGHLYSNAAQSTATGFTYNQSTFKVNWIL